MIAYIPEILNCEKCVVSENPLVYNIPFVNLNSYTKVGNIKQVELMNPEFLKVCTQLHY